jgi:hypothetical protein
MLGWLTGEGIVLYVAFQLDNVHTPCDRDLYLEVQLLFVFWLGVLGQSSLDDREVCARVRLCLLFLLS